VTLEEEHARHVFAKQLDVVELSVVRAFPVGGTLTHANVILRQKGEEVDFLTVTQPPLGPAEVDNERWYELARLQSFVQDIPSRAKDLRLWFTACSLYLGSEHAACALNLEQREQGRQLHQSAAAIGTGHGLDDLQLASISASALRGLAHNYFSDLNESD